MTRAKLVGEVIASLGTEQLEKIVSLLGAALETKRMKERQLVVPVPNKD